MLKMSVKDYWKKYVRKAVKCHTEVDIDTDDIYDMITDFDSEFWTKNETDLTPEQVLEIGGTQRLVTLLEMRENDELGQVKAIQVWEECQDLLGDYSSKLFLQEEDWVRQKIERKKVDIIFNKTSENQER